MDDLIDDDKLIYHWLPHGSRNLEHLTQHSGNNNNFQYAQIVMHDQEPYRADFWSDSEIRDAVKNYYLQHGHALTDDTLDFLAPKRLNGLLEFCRYEKSIVVHSNFGLDSFDHDNHEYCYYWCHALLARDWFRYASIDPIINQNHSRKAPTHTFLCYNRSWTGSREYRIKFLDLMIEHDLIQHFKTWFNPVEDNKLYTNHKFQNEIFKPLRTDLETFAPATLATSDSSADYCNQDYITTQWECVLETCFDIPSIFVSEKLLRPIATAQPFVCVAAAGTLQFLRSYGFKTYGDYIDETYDMISDPSLRLCYLIKTLKDCLNQPIREYQQMLRIARFNQQRFFSDDFINCVLDEYKTNMRDALEKLYTNPKSRLQLPNGEVLTCK